VKRRYYQSIFFAGASGMDWGGMKFNGWDSGLLCSASTQH
jgi:hypothetical protein